MGLEEERIAFPKQKRVVLSKAKYKKLQEKVFERDEYRCRNPFCGKRSNLTIHHIVRRSKLRLDTEDNCITLCADCNIAEKQGRLKIEIIAENIYKFIPNSFTLGR